MPSVIAAHALPAQPSGIEAALRQGGPMTSNQMRRPSNQVRRRLLRSIRAGALLAPAARLLAALPGAAQVQSEAPGLPERQAGRGPLGELLGKRRSSRAFAPDPLPEPLLHDLLWAAAGVNRPERGGRTAPSANNRQEVDVYVATAGGAFLYDPKAHRLQPVLANDVRELTGSQSFVKEAPVNLVYVADYAKSSGRGDEGRLLYAAATTGAMSQNVYLFCAAEGLATVLRAGLDRQALGQALNLRPTQSIVLAQTVGYSRR
jgi:SagB-type dehydrogenase family enzyme